VRGRGYLGPANWNKIIAEMAKNDPELRERLENLKRGKIDTVGLASLLDDIVEFRRRHPEPTYERGHLPAVKVPIGGSSCASCRFLSDDNRHCKNRHFIRWNNGSDRLPYPCDEYCSDWWTHGGD
jgi:hypothetical protein